jgi:hypothetical protein
MEEKGLDKVVGILLSNGYKVTCNGHNMGSVADLDKYLLDQQGGELCINFPTKTATIDQNAKTIFMMEE